VRAVLLAAWLLSLGCGNHCAPGNCNGCCDQANDVCVVGTQSTACGTNGVACVACSAGQFAQCVTGQCMMPALITGPASADFGQVMINTQAQQTLSFTNTGNLSLVISKVEMDGGDGILFSAEPVPMAPVDPNHSIDITFDFTPTAPGVFSTEAGLTSNAGSGPIYWVQLKGTGF
jgi:hypothetical protein